MPSYRVETLAASPELTLTHWICDGHDGRRAEPERIVGDRVVVPLRGRFAFRAPRVQAVASPCEGLFLRDGMTFEITHPHGEGDVCMAISGPLAARLVDAGPCRRPVSLRAQLVLAALARRRAPPLVAAEALGLALAPGPERPPRRRRDEALAARLAHEIALRFDERLGLIDLAARAGVSVFHACRAFRRVTGGSLHRFQRELRLRHALALVVGTHRPLTEIAYVARFAQPLQFGQP